MTIIIRNAIKNDAEQLKDLVGQMGSCYETNLKDIKDRILAFNCRGHQILIAEQHGFILGVIAFGCYEQLRVSGRCCHIDTLVIDGKHRKKGVGKLLIAAVEKYAIEYGAVTIELITANLRKITGTHDFYQSLGYKNHEILDYSYFAKTLL